nr:hypothetical protein [Tanacetum cinerariifolium]
LDIPLTRLETIDHALETLRAKVVSTKGEIASSLARVRATEQRDEIARDMISKLEDRVRAPLALSPATEAAIAQWITASPPLSSGSSSGFSSSPSGSSSSSPYAGPSRKRSHISSSSLETSHPSSPPSRKRCRSPTPLLSATTVCTPPIEMPPPYKRLKGSSSALHDDVHAKTTVEAKLDDHSEMIGEMYEHLLDIPLTRLETIDHALETLRAKV